MTVKGRALTLERLHQASADDKQPDAGAEQEAAGEDEARQSERRLGLGPQLHQARVADAAPQHPHRIQPLPPLPQRRQVPVL